MSNRFTISFEELPQTVTDVPDSSQEEHVVSNLDLEKSEKEVKRYFEISEGIESLIDIASRIKNPSKNQTSLLRVAASFSMIGSEKEARDIFPALESNKSISKEDFVDTIKNTINTIIAKIKEYWQKFLNFFKNLFQSNNSKKDKLEEDIKIFKNKKDKIDNKINSYSISRSLLTLDQSTKPTVKLRQVEYNIKNIYKLKPVFENLSKDYDKFIEGIIKRISAVSDNSSIVSLKYDIVKEHNKYTRSNLLNNIDINVELLDNVRFFYNKTDESFFDEYGFNGFNLNDSSNNKTLILTNWEELNTFFDNFDNDVMVGSKKNPEYSQISMAINKLTTFNEKDANLQMSKMNLINDINRQATKINNLYITYNSIVGKIYSSLSSLIENF